MRSGSRWLGVLAAIVLLVAIAIGAAIAAVWTALPLDHATLVIDGETVALPDLAGWPAALALVLAVLAVLLAAVFTVGGVAIAIVAAMLGVAVAAVAVVVTLLLFTWPLLLIGWLVWRSARRPSAVGARPELA
ncbi:MAG: hypothetical protein K8R60_00880 [Burkholderiales bacterium]|nr:hypothetical protein [Burkholderiales bacterium]